MKHGKPLLLAISFLILASSVQASDFLDASVLGESMSMPLDPDLVRRAVNAGVIVGDSSSSITGLERGMTSEAASGEVSGGTFGNAAGETMSQLTSEALPHLNSTGTWSLNLNDTDFRHLDLSLIQNGDVVLGYGSITSGKATSGVTASGSVVGDRMQLSVTVVDSLELYKLDLMPAGESVSGRYDAYSPEGNKWSGKAEGIASLLEPAAQVASKGAIKPAGSIEAAGPVDEMKTSSLGAGSMASEQAGPVTPSRLGASGKSSTTGTSSTSGSSFSAGSSTSSSKPISGMIPGKKSTASSGSSTSSTRSVSIGTGSPGSYSSSSSISSAIYG